jgi:hypothetical protein
MGFEKLVSTVKQTKSFPIKLIVGVVVFVLIVFSIFIFVGVRFFTRTEELSNQGSEYGKGKDNQACLDEALRRYVPTQNPIDQLSNAAFVGTCLSVSRPTEGFCVGVPEISVFNQKPPVDWAEGKCKEHGLEGQGCVRLFIAVISYCQAERHRR